MTPDKLSKIYKGMSNICWKCKVTGQEGTLYHMRWTFREAKNYWIQIYEYLHKILLRSILFKPELFLLNMLPESLDRRESHLVITYNNCSQNTICMKMEENRNIKS